MDERRSRSGRSRGGYNDRYSRRDSYYTDEYGNRRPPRVDRREDRRREDDYYDEPRRKASGSRGPAYGEDPRSGRRTAPRRSAGKGSSGNKKRKRRGRIRVIPVLFAILILMILLGGLGGLVFFEKSTGESFMSCIASGKKIAAASTAQDFQGGSVSYIYSADHEVMAELSLDNDRVYLTYRELPRSVVDAFVAIEDRSFWTNKGTDSKGMARVLFNFVRTLGKRKTGASTITQQLVKLTYLSSEKTLSRKVKEIVIARDITKKYSKEEIMSFYCNACCFANGIYGINDASRAYFGKDPKELTLSEAAYLCAIPNWPEHYNPRTNPENAITRRDKILKDMLGEGYISQSEYDAAVKEEMNIHSVKEQVNRKNFETTYAINCAAKVLLRRQGFEFRTVFSSNEDYKEYQEVYDEAMKAARHELSIGGYRIYTTIDPQAQTKMQEVVDQALEKKEARLDTGIYQVQGAMTVIDNENGKVVAIVGGRSQQETEGMYTLNRAFQGYAQPGSSIKPLVVYAPALDTGDYHAGSNLQNISVSEAKESKATVAEIREMTGDEVPLYKAVEKSLNGCAYWLFSQIGVANGLDYIQRMDFSRIVPEDYNMSACLGGLTYGVTTEEMANAYYTLENNGTFRDTDCILSMQDINGYEIYEDPREVDIYSPEASMQMTQAMKGVLTRGTAASADWYDYTDTEAAGKTGTTNDNKAAWFCGYTPYYTMAVWVGCDTPTVVEGLNGNSFPLTIWKNGMLKMIEGKPAAQLSTVEIEEEGPECICDLLCSEEFTNYDCPACAEDIQKCVGAAAICICSDRCEGDSLNETCPVCLYSPERCVGLPLCTCGERCSEFSVDRTCIRCDRDWMLCEAEVPEYTEPETTAPVTPETNPPVKPEDPPEDDPQDEGEDPPEEDWDPDPAMEE